MNNKLMHIVTIGCQMNVYDSGQIRGAFLSKNYLETQVVEEADLIIVNTCAIRQKAEQKAFSFLGRMSKLKIKKPSLIIAVGGCVAQQYGSGILKRMPFIDLVFGTDAVNRLFELVSSVESSRCRIVDVNISRQSTDRHSFFTDGYNSKKISAFVTVMRGCDNYCTYCIVPYVRGREVSRNPDKIIDEIKTLVISGVKEVVLLGQNVNSYGIKEKLNTFSQLLTRVSDIHGLERIRFTTSNPKDLSEDLMDIFSSIDKVCNHIHLPVQSGDNSILRRMNRKYTRESYIEKVTKLRSKCPDIAVTSDFIVGFPGESDKQFEATLDLINLIRFDSSFAFSYSDRPNVSASKFSNKISNRTKKDRLQRLLLLQNSISLEKNHSMIGTIQKVLVEGPYYYGSDTYNANIGGCKESNSGISHWFGRTSTNRIIHFKNIENDHPINLKGHIVSVRIISVKSHSLRGELLTNEGVKDCYIKQR